MQYNTAQSQQLKFTVEVTPHSVILRSVQLCAEFCQEQFGLCRPLLAFNENINFFLNIPVCVILPNNFINILKG